MILSQQQPLSSYMPVQSLKEHGPEPYAKDASLVPLLQKGTYSFD